MKKIITALVAGLILMMNFPLFAQEGIITACYLEEKTALGKMWKARESGDEDKVKKISSEITELITERKTWAVELLKVTKASIEKTENELGRNLSPEELKAINERIRKIHQMIRSFEMELEVDRWEFYKANHINRIEIEINKDAIKNIMETSEKNIKEHLNVIEDLKKSIETARVTGEKQLIEINERIKRTKDEKEKESHIQALKRLKTLIATEEYCHHPSAPSVKQNRDDIAIRKKMISKIKKDVKEKTYSHGAGWPVKSYLDWIKHAELCIKNRKMEFTTLTWRNMKYKHDSIRDLKNELAKLENEAGTKDERLQKLLNTEKELEKFLNHDFLTKLPEEESGFIKAIKWCIDAVDKIKKAVDKYKYVKDVVDILKNSNPKDAADKLLKKITGKGLIETIGEKLLPDSITKNKYYKEFVESGFDTKKILKEMALKELPEDVKDKIETLKKLKNDPSGYLKSEAWKEVETIIEANPHIKKIMDKISETKKYIENPEYIKIKMENRLKEYGENSPEYQKLKTKMIKYDERIKKLVDLKRKQLKQFETGITEKFIIKYKDIIEDRISKIPQEKIDFVEEILEITN